jgi:GTP-binding protein
MRFIDEAKIKVRAGSGGPGIIAWRREKFVPLGGPSGGNGGKGGDVVFVAKEGMNSLLDLKQQSLLTSEEGNKGQSKNKSGRNGRDRIVFVPVGTQVALASSPDEITFDLTRNEQRVVICRGGDGGFGNSHFKSQGCSAPEKATVGFKGEERELILTLKLMADVGLLGFPNAGKSTLLSRLSNARPKVADYPFTTLKPMVGVCELDLARSMVIADIPGLIEGASLGYGLGFRFLKHLERVRILCHLIDGSLDEDITTRYNTINKELELYGDKLATLPQIVVINKIDALSPEQEEKVEEFINSLKIPVLKISAVTGDGLTELQEALFKASNRPEEIVEKSKFDPTVNLY